MIKISFKYLNMECEKKKIDLLNRIKSVYFKIVYKD